MKSWKKRYFNLYNNGVLTYTSEASSTEILGEIDIKCAKIEIQEDNTHDEDGSPSTGRTRSLSGVFVGRYDIKISTSDGKRVLKLRCPTNFDKQAWIGALDRSSNLSVSASGDHGIFIELFWDLGEAADKPDNHELFLRNETELGKELLRHCVYCISFTASKAQNFEGCGPLLRRWAFILSSEVAFYKRFKSSKFVSACFESGYKILRCNVAGKLYNGSEKDDSVKRLISLFQLQDGLSACDYHYNYVHNNVIAIEPMAATSFILNPQAFFQPAHGVLVRRSYAEPDDGNATNILQIIKQIETSAAYVARADYPGVLTYHVYFDKTLDEKKSRLNVVELYANNTALDIFLKDEQIVRLKLRQMSLYTKKAKIIERICLHATKMPPPFAGYEFDTVEFMPGGFVARSQRTSECFGKDVARNAGYVLHQTPAMPTHMTKSVGWMSKRKRNSDPWRRRFFVILPDGSFMIRYYLSAGKNLSGDGERGSFSLENLTIYLHGGSRSVNFTLSSPKEPLPMSLKARTTTEYSRWIQNLTPYAQSIYNLDSETLITGTKPPRGLDTFNIDNIAISAIALQLDQILFSNGDAHRSGNRSDSLSLDVTDNQVNSWFLKYSAGLNAILSAEDTNPVAQTITWFQTKLVKYFKRHFDTRSKSKKNSITEKILASAHENAKDAKRFIRRKYSSTFKDWLQQEYAAGENETFSETCYRHADSVRFFIECVYALLCDEYKKLLDTHKDELAKIYCTKRLEDEIDELFVCTTVIAVERRILTPIYDYVEFFVTCIEGAYEVDQKLIAIRNSINMYSKRLGMTIEEVFDALESTSRWQRPVEILNTIENLKQPAEMVSRLMAVMHSVTDTYEEEERNRLKEDTFQPDPIGADDIVPILLAVVTRSTLKKPQTVHQMMSNVSSSYIINGKSKYYLTMFESVLYYLSTKGEEVVRDLRQKVDSSKLGKSKGFKRTTMNFMRTLSYDSGDKNGLDDAEDNLQVGGVESALEVEVRRLIVLEDRLRKLNGNIGTVHSLLKINQRSLTMMKNRMYGGTQQVRNTLIYIRENDNE